MKLIGSGLPLRNLREPDFSDTSPNLPLSTQQAAHYCRSLHAVPLDFERWRRFLRSWRHFLFSATKVQRIFHIVHNIIEIFICLNKNGRKALDLKNSLAANFQAGASLTVKAYTIICDGMDSHLNMRLICVIVAFHIYSCFVGRRCKYQKKNCNYKIVPRACVTVLFITYMCAKNTTQNN